MDWQAGGFGLYVHWPFCLAKCPYCDFNSHVWREIDQPRWTRALIAELENAAQETPGRVVQTVFFGGGTPSLMDPETVDALLTAIRRLWPQAEDMEITLEANPTSVEAGRFAAYASAGVNRLSMGIQALNDADLRLLGRMHNVAEAERAFALARGLFPRVSFDLIYARAGQSVAGWLAELDRAINMAVDHLSLYQLTIEPGTRFAELTERGRVLTAPDPLAADLYLATQDFCAARGLPAYEISNHAAPGRESRHNCIYWRYGDYVGVGPGAHGRITTSAGRMATETIRDPANWLKTVEKQGHARHLTEFLDGMTQATEMLMMGLRLSEGISLSRYAALAGQELDQQRLAPLCAEGLLQINGDRLVATTAGRPVLNALLRALL